jgi:CDP-diacylglycerol pyrophosphatase
MGHYTLVVVGVTLAHRKPGFIVLADRADPAHGDKAGGEELQDHTCALGHQAR